MWVLNVYEIRWPYNNFVTSLFCLKELRHTFPQPIGEILVEFTSASLRATLPHKALLDAYIIISIVAEVKISLEC